MKENLQAILKIFVFLLLLPLVIASAGAFQLQVLGLPVHKEEWFLWGAVAFILTYLFFYDFKEAHTFGQGIVSHFSKSFQSFADMAGMVIPVYTIFIAVFYLVFDLLGVNARYEGYLLLALGFSVAMHIVLTARHLYETDSDPLKAQYFLMFSVVFIFSLFIIALLVGLVVREFSFLGFLKVLSHRASSHYEAIFKVLFVSSS